MIDKTLYIKAYNALKKKFKLKDIGVVFWSSAFRLYRYRTRPYLAVITDDDVPIALNVADPYNTFDYVYVDEFEMSKYIPDSSSAEVYAPIQPWQIAKSLFNLAQKSPVYLFMPNVDPYYCDEKQYILLDKSVQLYEFLICVDLNT